MEFYFDGIGKWTAFIQRISCNQWPSNALYNTASHSPIHSFTHSHTDGGVDHARRQPARRGAVRVRCLAHGHLDTQARRSRGSNQRPCLVTSQPALPPELLPPTHRRRPWCVSLCVCVHFEVCYICFCARVVCVCVCVCVCEHGERKR